MRNPVYKFALLLCLSAGLIVVAGCASSGSFESYDRDDSGGVSKQEANGRIYYFDSYDKDHSGSLEREEFRWAIAASDHRRDKENGTGDLPASERPDGGSIIGTNNGGSF